jgi:quercetin dioxygenase-like cupin family protein
MVKGLCVGVSMLVVAGVVTFALSGVRGARAQSAPSGAREVNSRSEILQEIPGTRMTAVEVVYEPGGRSAAHHHAGSVFAYILEGAVRSQNSATGPERTYRAGESFFEPAGSIHLVSENASTTEPARLLAVFVAPNGATLTTLQP